jgi:hypothetical protein
MTDLQRRAEAVRVVRAGDVRHLSACRQCYGDDSEAWAHGEPWTWDTARIHVLEWLAAARRGGW